LFSIRDLTAKDVALIICFTALYAVFATIPIFQILGMPSRNITAAAIAAPIIGSLLGPYVGTLSTTFGGAISFYWSFFPPSFFAGITTALCAGLLHKGKRIWCILIYLALLVAFGFYPYTGPAWLFPLSMWFQIAGFLILVSPLITVAVKNVKSNSKSKLVSAFFTISLTSTLAGQIAGSLTFMLLFPAPLGGWQALWEGLTIVYPIERTVIALGSAFIGAPLFRVLQSANLTRAINRENSP
jgi:MFS family permease